MKTVLFKTTLLLFSLIAFKISVAQCDTNARLCDTHIKDGFISDGQNYRSLLLDDEVAEFNMILYGESTYRFAGCSGLTDGNLIFFIYDENRNVLFTNTDYSNAPYWDFEVTHTISCTIEAQLNPTTLASGCAVLLVGFKQ